MRICREFSNAKFGHFGQLKFKDIKMGLCDPPSYYCSWLITHKKRRALNAVISSSTFSIFLGEALSNLFQCYSSTPNEMTFLKAADIS